MSERELNRVEVLAQVDDGRHRSAVHCEIRRLSAVLEFTKYGQDKAPPKMRRAGKQRRRYEPTGRKPPRRNA